MIGFAVGYDFPNVFAYVGPFRDQIQSFDPPTLSVCSEQLKSAADSVLNYSVVASDSVTLASLIAFENHRGIRVVEIRF